MTKYIPYGRQSIDEDDIKSVADVLRSDWLTTGPAVDIFEKSVSSFVGMEYAVAVSSGTAALHAAMYALGISNGDEVIVPTITFAATANSVVFQGGIPVFCDVEADTLLIDPELVESKITSKTKAIIAVDYAGQTCQYDALRVIANKHDLVLVSDACHSIGGAYNGRKVGTLADLTVFSFHPVKRRQEIACRYDESFEEFAAIKSLNVISGNYHAYHLYVIKVMGFDRNEVFNFLRNAGIGVNVHYVPVHLHPFYQKRFDTKPGLCPVAEAAYSQILSLPIFPSMTNEDVETVIQAVNKAVSKNTKSEGLRGNEG